MDDVAVALGRRIIARKDVKAVQREGSGAYFPDKSPISLGDLRAHVNGARTLGTYLVNLEGQSKVFTFDLDLDTGGPREHWAEAPDQDPEKQRLRRQLHQLGFGLAYRVHRLLEIPVGVAYSGCKGIHVIAFVGLGPASQAKAMAMGILDDHPVTHPVKGDLFWKNDHFPDITIEVFPKQDSVSPGEFGNLIRLPLGIHRKSGREGYFLAPCEQWKPDDPLLALSEGSTRRAREPWGQEP